MKLTWQAAHPIWALSGSGVNSLDLRQLMGCTVPDSLETTKNPRHELTSRARADLSLVLEIMKGWA
jgi:hypothetical protein